jgi:hypothetical protein
MKDALSAFGIFSINRFQCAGFDTLFQFSCIDRYQLQVVRGPYYVRIISESGSAAAQKLSRSAAAVIHKKLWGGENILTPLLKSPTLVKQLNELRYFSGSLGVQNGAPDRSAPFEGIKKFTAYYLPVDMDSSHTELIDAEFLNEEDPIRFQAQLGFTGNKPFQEMHSEGIYKFLWIKESRHIIYLQTNRYEEATGKILLEIQKYQVR